jgi:hypothetical protein
MAELLPAATRSLPDHVQQLQQAQGNRLRDHESHPRGGQANTRSNEVWRELTDCENIISWPIVKFIEREDAMLEFS